jgi:hypothetical protein
MCRQKVVTKGLLLISTSVVKGPSQSLEKECGRGRVVGGGHF